MEKSQLLNELKKSSSLEKIDATINHLRQSNYKLSRKDLIEILNATISTQQILKSLQVRNDKKYPQNVIRRTFFIKVVDSLTKFKDTLDTKTRKNLQKLYNTIYITLLKTDQNKDNILFYHANSVSTSIEFIKNKKIFSRDFGESNGFKQSEQNSDDLDRDFDIYNDIFFDNSDIAQKITSAYGPITFVLKATAILESDIEVRVTKKNPVYWKDSAEYFEGLEELAEKIKQPENYNFSNNHGYHTTLKNCSTITLTPKNLEKIYVENDKNIKNLSKLLEKKSVPSSGHIKNKFEELLTSVGLSGIPVIIRNVDEGKEVENLTYSTSLENLWKE